MSDDERRNWENWAHANLMDIQHLLDDLNYARNSQDPLIVERQNQLKAELSTTADELVQVHGLIHGGYIEYAVSALKRLEQRAIHTRALACAKS